MVISNLNKRYKGFEEMWETADYEDAKIGGVDSIPEEEYDDYIQSCFIKQFQEVQP